MARGPAGALICPLRDGAGAAEVVGEYAGLVPALLRPGAAALGDAIGRRAATGWAAVAGDRAVGVLTYAVRGGRAHVEFIHVAESWQGRGIEESLVQGALEGFRGLGIEEVRADVLVAGDPEPVHRAFDNLGCESFPKALMERRLGPKDAVSPPGNPRGAYPPPPGFTIGPWQDQYREDAARVIHEAHARRADSHRDVQDLASALRQVSGTMELPAFDLRASSVALAPGVGACLCGLALVTRPAPNLAFVTEMAVLPGHQRRGIGTALLSRVAQVCLDGGVEALYLVVSVGNLAAVGLYRKLGFASAMPLLSYRLRLSPEAP